MSRSLSTFPIILLFVCSAISVDVNKSKRVLRERVDIDKRTYNLNQPPLADGNDPESVTELYNNYKGKEESNTESILDESFKTDGDNKAILKDSDKIIPAKISNDANKGGSLIPKSRSLSVGAQVTGDPLLQNLNNNKSNNRRRSQRRRLPNVKKTNINENETKVETIETTTIKNLQNGNKYVTPKYSSQTPADRPQSTTIRSRTRTRDPVVPIIESENYVYSHRGNFHYSYEGGDGTRAFERGELKRSENGSGMGEAVEGSFSYTDKDGNDFSLSYTADENGYRPVGAHLPTPPPIPPEIQAALRLLATKTTPEPVTERVKKS